MDKDLGKQTIDGLGGQLRFEQDNNRLVLTKDLNDVLLIGLDDAGAAVVKIAKPGFDAKTATPDQLIFNSAQNMLKVAKTDTASLAVPTSHVANDIRHFTIPHGLDHVPAVIGYVLVEFDDDLVGSFWCPIPYGENQLGLEATILADDTNIYLRAVTVDSSWISSPLQFRYYLLQETAN